MQDAKKIDMLELDDLCQNSIAVKLKPANNKIAVSLILSDKAKKNLHKIDGFLVMVGYSGIDTIKSVEIPKGQDRCVFTKNDGIINGRSYYISLRIRKGDLYSSPSDPVGVTPSILSHLWEDNCVHDRKRIYFPTAEELENDPFYCENTTSPKNGGQADEENKEACQTEEKIGATGTGQDGNAVDKILFLEEGAVGECGCGNPVKLTAKMEYRCTDPKCLKEYVFNVRGKMLEAARLKWGTCRCCTPKKILVYTEDKGLVCSATQRKHALFPDGRSVLLDCYGLGACTCCKPPRPLVNYGNGVQCSGSGEKYIRQNGVLTHKKPDLTTDVLEINELLDAGEITVLPGGVVHKDEDLGEARGRRRRRT